MTPQNRQQWIYEKIRRDKEVLRKLSTCNILSVTNTNGLKTPKERFDSMIALVYASIKDLEDNKSYDYAQLDDAVYCFERNLNGIEVSELIHSIDDGIHRLLKIAYRGSIPKRFKNQYRPYIEQTKKFDKDIATAIVNKMNNSVCFFDLSAINETNYANYINPNPIEYYVYALYDLTNNRIFYVGKGKGQRMYKHRRCQENAVKHSYIKSISGNYVELVLTDGLTHKSALDKEAIIIKNNYEDLTNIDNPLGSRERNRFNSLAHFSMYAKKFGVNELLKLEYNG